MLKQIKTFCISILLLMTLIQTVGARSYSDIEKSCKKNDAKSCYMLAQLTRKSDVKKQLYRKSCKMGYAKSCTKLASYYAANYNDKKQFNEAVKYHKLGCKGYADGCRQLADLYSFVNEDKKAAKYYEVSCKKGSAYGCRELAWVYEKGIGVQKNTKNSFYYYQQTCELESSECWYIGEHYFNGTLDLKVDYAKAKHYFETSCRGNSAAGCYKLGNIYYAGKGVKQDYRKAKSYYEKSCNRTGDSYRKKGCNNLAVIYEKGKGVKKDRSKAKYYYGQACEFGYDKACKLK